MSFDASAAYSRVITTVETRLPRSAFAVFCWERAWYYQDRFGAAINSLSGTDQAESECWRMLARAWQYLAIGESLADVWAWFDSEWRKYAAECEAKVKAAARIKRGPRAGQSVIDHRWVSPDKAQQQIPHTVAMYRRACELEGAPSAPVFNIA